jgi:hypothetical protein
MMIYGLCLFFGGRCTIYFLLSLPASLSPSVCPVVNYLMNGPMD